MAQHWSGTRSGWNQRGGTDAEHLRIALAVARRKAEDALSEAASVLIGEIGRDAYLAWVDGNLAETDTLEEMTAKILAYLESIKNSESCNNLVEG